MLHFPYVALPSAQRLAASDMESQPLYPCFKGLRTSAQRLAASDMESL